jgi:hypothetical protein
MTALRTLPAKDPAERVLLLFDFGAEMPAGDTVATALVAVEAVVAGQDATPAVLDGGPTASGQAVLQWVIAGVEAASYRLRCTATTAQGRVLVLRAVLPVRTVT